MPYIVSVVGQKGGIGKTTTAMSLAAVAAEAARVLLVDTDPQGSATWWARQVGERLPFDFATDTGAAQLQHLRRAEHDVVLLDTPGSLEGHHVLGAVISASDLVVLPTQAAALTLVPLLRTVREVVAPRRVTYRVLLNIVDPRSPGEIEEARALLTRHRMPFFQATVRRYRAHERAPLDGLVVTQYPLRDRYSMRAVEDYRSVARELFELGRPTSRGRHAVLT
ncbi:MAG TPA: ParA family protein [Kineosporiaceae bacterium]